jgi:hypothetical protein
VTTPDSRPVLDVIADAIEAEIRKYPTAPPAPFSGQIGSLGATIPEIAAAVLAACQGATVAQQAELTGGTVAHRNGRTAWAAERVVGPWREDPVKRPDLPLHRTWANVGVSCSTCDDGGCPDCTDPS